MKVSGVAPGTTQVRAKVGGGMVCSTKNVTAARVEFAVDSLTLCNCHPETVAVTVEPAGVPVSYLATNASIAEVTAQDTNVTINPLVSGRASVFAKLGNATLDQMQVKSIMVTFPTNEWFALRGVPQNFTVQLPPGVAGAEVSFSISNASIATLTSAPPELTITGLSNGTAQITARIGTNQSCGTKTITIFSAQLQTIEFTSDHNLICDGTHETNVNAGTRFPTVEWNPGAGVNAPMTHTAGTNTKVTAALGVAITDFPIGTPLSFSLSGTSREPTLRFGSTNTATVQGLYPLGREIRTINEKISWSLNVSGNALPLGDSGPHLIFTTMGTPNTNAPLGGSIPNVPRMRIATDRIASAIAWTNAPDSYTCYPRIVWRVVADGGGYTLSNFLFGVQVWDLPNTKADCTSIARFARNVCMVEGMPGILIDVHQIGALYRTQEKPHRPTNAFPALTDGAGRPNVYPNGTNGTPMTTGLSNTWFLALVDRANGINAFEAALRYVDSQGKQWYLPAGVRDDPHYDNANSVVQIFLKMVWCEDIDHDGDPNTKKQRHIRKDEYFYTLPLDVDLCPP